MCQLYLELNGFERTIIESEFQLVGEKAKIEAEITILQTLIKQWR